MSDDSLPQEPEECKKATEKAMNLLLIQDRTKKELQDRLVRAGFSEKATVYAMDYVTRYGYINDRRYAETYISFHRQERSKTELRYKLIKKGISNDILAVAFEDYDSEDEREALTRALERRLKGRQLSELIPKERDKITAYLGRKGFPPSMIYRAIKEHRDQESND